MRAWLIGSFALVLLAQPGGARGQDVPVQLPEPAPTVSERLGAPAAVPSPRVRIGLDLDEPQQVRVGALSGGYRILDGRGGGEVWTGRADGEVLVVPEGGRSVSQETVFRVQVGSFRNETEARALAESLEREHREPADAYWQPSRGVWRVRIGREERRGALDGLLRRLRATGYPDAWIASEPRERREGGTLRLLDSRWDVRSSGSDSLVFVAARGGRLTVDGRPYRGLVEVLLDPYGRLRSVNELPLESYLRGVVPKELGPAAWPEVEALKAQTIAARTYVLANLGQYAEEGYDICDTPRCQVYGGAAAEHPLTDRAIRATRGEILVYEGQPINAMYTSTCGGYTEDVENVFPDLRGPYLRGVPARPPQPRLEEMLIRISGRSPGRDDLRSRQLAEPGPRQLVGLVAGGVIPRTALDASWRAAGIEAGELRDWVAALARKAGKPAPPPAPSRAHRLALMRWWRQALGPSEPATALLGPGDAPYLLAIEDRGEVPEGDRVLVASLIVEGIVVPGPEGRLLPGEVPPRGEVLGWLARAAERYDAIDWRSGVVVGEGADGGIELREGRVERRWSLDDSRPDLLVSLAGAWHRVGSIEVLPGDELSWIADPQATGLRAVAVEERRGVADDRFGSLYRWERVRTRDELERGLADVAPVGRLKDLRVLERGVSGRVHRLELVGTAGRALVEGFRIRRALGLPETLFTLERQHQPDGLLRRVIFSGRGWGHGVGLCQIGAYGMALRGKSYREILSHYYTGTRLVRAEP
jgi:stage II sporulation protein D